MRPDARIYFMRDIENGLIKVGFSTDPAGRLKTLQQQIGHGLELLAVSGNFERVLVYGYELALHEILGVSRHHGEWFYPSRMLAMMIGACTSELAHPSAFGSDDFYVRRLLVGARAAS